MYQNIAVTFVYFTLLIKDYHTPIQLSLNHIVVQSSNTTTATASAGILLIHNYKTHNNRRVLA